MFRKRKEFADDDELNRQLVLLKIMTEERVPSTIFEFIGCALMLNKHIDPIVHLKVDKNIDTVLTLVQNTNDLKHPEVRDSIAFQISSTNIDIGDMLRLPLKPPVFAITPEPVDSVVFDLETSKIPNDVSVYEFENIMFNNKTSFQYLRGTDFTAYLYQNLLFCLGAESIEQLSSNLDWRSRLASLLYMTNLSTLVAVTAFYSDTVTYEGKVFDTSFVPKYDVKNLLPLEEPSGRTIDREMITFYEQFVPSKFVGRVPIEYMGLFSVFPFKNGFYVQPNGEVIFMNIYPTNKRSIKIYIENLCSHTNLQQAIFDAVRKISYEDALAYALYAPSLNTQGMALMILRHMVGLSVYIEPYKIPLPDEYTILSWTRYECKQVKTMTLPQGVETKNITKFVEIIQNIAQSCGNKQGACILASNYRMLECEMAPIYSQLQNDAEKYVFCTMMLQDHYSSTYFNIRKRLNPKFQSRTDISLTHKYTPNPRPFINTSTEERAKKYTEPLITISDTSVFYNTRCSPHKCPDNYEFADKRYRELVRTGTLNLNRAESTRFIAATLSSPYTKLKYQDEPDLL